MYLLYLPHPPHARADGNASPGLMLVGRNMRARSFHPGCHCGRMLERADAGGGGAPLVRAPSPPRPPGRRAARQSRRGRARRLGPPGGPALGAVGGGQGGQIHEKATQSKKGSDRSQATPRRIWVSTVILKTSPFANFRGIGRNYGPFWVDRPAISCRTSLGGNLEAGCNNKPSLPFGD